MFREADIDADGKISPEEFLDYARKHRELWPQLKSAIFPHVK